VYASDAAFVTANGAAAAGDTYYNSATNKIKYYNGTAWFDVANGLLSNLGTTDINATLTPNSDAGLSLGSLTKRWASIYANNFLVGNQGSRLAANVGANMRLYSPDAATTTGNIDITTGSVTAGTDNSGDITVATGTSTGGVRGKVVLDGRYVNVPSGAADPATGDIGSLFFNTTSGVLRFHNGTAWADLGGGGGDTGIFALLAGRAGGQTLIGGTAASENLILTPTSHATRGKIFFGSNSAYDDVNRRLGINTTSPGVGLDVGLDFALRQTNDITTAGALTSVNVTGISHVRFTAATSIEAFNPIANGKILIVHNTNTVPLVLKNETGATANQRIVTGTGADYSLPPGEVAILTYNNAATRWKLLLASNAWVYTPTVFKNAGYTANYGDEVIIVSTAPGAAPLTITLPTAVGVIGKKFTIKKAENTIYSVTVATTGGQLIDAAANYVIENPYEAITVVSDGSGWHII
jgi:hypothetical protein